MYNTNVTMTKNAVAVETYLEEHYGGSYEAYLLDYYSEKDGVAYEDFAQLVEESTCLRDLKGTTGATLGSTIAVPSNYYYDDFYKNLLSFLYGDDSIKSVTGNVKYVQKAKKMTRAEADAAYGAGFVEYLMMLNNCTEDSLLAYYRDADGNEGTLFDLPEEVDYNSNGWFYKDADGNKVYLEPVYEGGYLKADNNSWSTSGVNATVGDYMTSQLTESGAWAEADQYFKKLLADGVTSEEASWIAFNLALNLDGNLTGNTYQLSQWSWYNTIVLRQADGDLNIHKVDGETGESLAGVGFELWKIETVTKEDGTEENINRYFFGTPVLDEDGNVLYYTGTFMEKDESSDCVLYTNADGNIYIRFLDEEGTYQLKEAVTLDGYGVDPDTYDIVIEGGTVMPITLENYPILNGGTDSNVVHDPDPDTPPTDDDTENPSTEGGETPDNSDPGTVEPTPAVGNDPAVTTNPKTDGTAGVKQTVSESTTTTSKASESSLPQTGQDWNLVIVLAIAGTAILMVGLLQKRRKEA
jgi:LPXTG-motif cell wall-anchored protein